MRGFLSSVCQWRGRSRSALVILYRLSERAKKVVESRSKCSQNHRYLLLITSTSHHGLKVQRNNGASSVV